ncbi:MAG: peptidoglycan DD-metalloendopeptidase family protein [Gemmatimonadetes bacterium]|nr:peptidoglycan DD-metalloendopeptidase family protein [Gemmatimonadota bacterium]
MSNKRYSLIIAPSDGSKSYQLQVDRRTLVVLIAALAVLLMGFAFMIVTYGGLMHRVRNWQSLQGRVAELEARESHYQGLELEVVELREMDRRVRSLIGLPEAPSVTAEATDAGVNGAEGLPAGAPRLVLSEAIMPDEAQLKKIEKDLDKYHEKWRWPAEGFVSSEFGEERESGGIHSGLDIAAPRNTLIEAPRGGTVSAAGWNDTYGWVVVLDHGDGLNSIYCHNTKLVVQEGDKVSLGDPIAFLGNTGISTAPHLHFEIRKDGYAIDPVYLLSPERNL